MTGMTRYLPFLVAIMIVGGCGSKSDTPEAVATSDEVTESTGESTQGDLIEACELKMTAPVEATLTAYWDPRGKRMAQEGPSHAHSSYWASQEEREMLGQSNALVPLDVTCSAGSDTGEILVNFVALASAESDVPFGPGSYPIVSRKGLGKVRPQEFVASLYLGEANFEANSGTLTIDRFDAEGVAGSFSVDAQELFTGERPFKVAGTFDIPCRGGVAEGACQANKAIYH